MSNETYFTEYEKLEIHELMLRDKPRQEAYYEAIMSNAEMFKDKVVLDVGAGTGILSIFCANAGAKLVYAVEATNLAKIAIETVEENELTHKIKVIHSKIENFQLPKDIEFVDIIVSEWMGFYLLHEAMLESVIFARDTFLKPNTGQMFPEIGMLHMAPCSVSARFGDWENIDGVKMTKFATKLREEKSQKPEIMNLHSDELLGKPITILYIELKTVTVQELNEIRMTEVVPAIKTGIHQGFCLWFSVQFPRNKEDSVVTLDTSPFYPSTHWKQCVIVLPEYACDTVEESTPISFSIEMRRNLQDTRKYDIGIELLDPNEVEHPIPCQCYLTKCILTREHINLMETES